MAKRGGFPGGMPGTTNLAACTRLCDAGKHEQPYETGAEDAETDGRDYQGA